MDEINLRNYAYLGDAVWELHIRKKTICLTNNAKKLHQITTNLVKTDYQCEMLNFIEKYLTEEENELTRRARNLPIPVGRRNIQHNYRLATAFETLIGWWFLNNKTRLEAILNLIEEKIHKDCEKF
jgi:ribonuclease-3 family protein